MSELPRDNVARDALEWPCCPWCGADMSEATVTLGGLCDMWLSGEFSRPWRGAEGQPNPGAVTVDCPSCRRPSMLALQGNGDAFRLLAVRTKSDVELLGGTWGRFL